MYEPELLWAARSSFTMYLLCTKHSAYAPTMHQALQGNRDKASSRTHGPHSQQIHHPAKEAENTYTENKDDTYALNQDEKDVSSRCERLSRALCWEGFWSPILRPGKVCEQWQCLWEDSQSRGRLGRGSVSLLPKTRGGTGREGVRGFKEELGLELIYKNDRIWVDEDILVRGNMPRHVCVEVWGKWTEYHRIMTWELGWVTELSR